MKKILVLGFVIALFTASASASAQQSKISARPGHSYHQRYDHGKFSRGERAKLHQNDRQYNRAKKKFKRDGRISRMERNKLYKMKRHDRRETYRFRHNSRRS